MTIRDTIKRAVETARGYSRKPYTRDEQKAKNLTNRQRKGSSDVEPWEHRAAARVRAEASRKSTTARRVAGWSNRNVGIEIPHGISRLDAFGHNPRSENAPRKVKGRKGRRAPAESRSSGYSPMGAGALNFSGGFGTGRISFSNYRDSFKGQSPAPKGKRRTTRRRDDYDPFRIF